MSECFNSFILINGKIISSAKFDDKLIHKGISFYEVVRIIQNKYLFLEDHMERLNTSVEIFNINYKPDIQKIIEFLFKYKMNIGISEGNIKVVINYSDCTDNIPQIFVYQIKHYYPSIQQYIKGVTLTLTSGVRDNPNSKFLNLKIKNLVIRKLAKSKHFESLLVNHHHCITEGSKSNVFFIKSGNLLTAPDAEVLLGITRNYVIGICDELKIPVIYNTVPANNIQDYDAVFITGTSIKILPVNKIDNRKYDAQNSLIRKLMVAFDRRINDYINLSHQ